MSNAKLFVLTEVSDFMMSYVIYTDRGNVIIVDGGRPEDVPELREKVKGRRIVAWFLTHPQALSRILCKLKNAVKNRVKYLPAAADLSVAALFAI